MLTDGRTTDAGVTGILIAHLGAFGSGELKILTKNDIIVHCNYYNKFPNLGVYSATFPNLKGPRAPSQKCKKIPARDHRL